MAYPTPIQQTMAGMAADIDATSTKLSFNPTATIPHRRTVVLQRFSPALRTVGSVNNVLAPTPTRMARGIPLSGLAAFVTPCAAKICVPKKSADIEPIAATTAAAATPY